MNNVFSRHVISQQLKVRNLRGEEFNYETFVELIGRWHAVFDHIGLKKGQVFAVNGQQSVEHMSLAFAAFERGLVYLAIPFASYYDQPLAIQAGGIDVACIFEQQSRESVWNVPKFNLETVWFWDPVEAAVEATADDLILLTMTSGSTGAPKQITHTHRSLMASVRNSVDQLFSENDRVLLYMSMNHVGVISVQVLPVFLAGCDVTLNDTFNNDEFVQALIQVKPEKTIIFPPNLQTFMQRPDWKTLRLDFLKQVIFGGTRLVMEYAEVMFSLGVEEIVNVYGLTECLPPVFIQRVTKQNLETVVKPDYAVLGTATNGWEVKLHPFYKTLQLRGPALGGGSRMVERLDRDGFFNTADVVEFKDGEYRYFKRSDRIVRRGELLVNLENISSTLVRSHPAVKNAYCIASDDKLILAVTPRAPIDLESVNACLTNQMGSHCVVDELIETEQKLPVDQIKAVWELRKRYQQK